MTSVRNDKCLEWQAFGMTSVQHDKCLEWQVSKLTPVWNDKDFVVQIFLKKVFFAPIALQVFLKDSPALKESIGILGGQIRPLEVLEKKRTHRQTYTRTFAN